MSQCAPFPQVLFPVRLIRYTFFFDKFFCPVVNAYLPRKQPSSIYESDSGLRRRGYFLLTIGGRTLGPGGFFFPFHDFSFFGNRGESLSERSRPMRSFFPHYTPANQHPSNGIFPCIFSRANPPLLNASTCDPPKVKVFFPSLGCFATIF